MNAPPLNGGAAADMVTSDTTGLRRYKTSLPDQLFDGDKAMCGLSFALTANLAYHMHN